MHTAVCEDLSQVAFGFECVLRMYMEGCTHIEKVCPQSVTKEVCRHSHRLCVI